jgi:hypothetical protein
VDAVGPRFRRSQGASRLLEHYEALARLTGRDGASARVRLESALGPELASRLVGALAERRARPPALV